MSTSLTRAVGRLCWAGKETSRGLVGILRRLLQSETEGLLEANLIRRKVLHDGCHARKNLGRHRRCGDPPVPFQTVILETIMYPETREMLLN